MAVSLNGGVAMLGTIWLFKHFGLEFLFRWAHVVVGIMWIGLLWYFNFVQVPAFAAMDAAARNDATDKLASRALWWFRWAAAATFVFGIVLLLLILGDYPKDSDYFKSGQGMSITAGMLFGITMFLNVWGVIWVNQKVVIANARNVQAGGTANPDAPAAARRSALASRQNTVFSFPMIFFMVGAAHFSGSNFDTTSDRWVWYVVVVVAWALLELNCLGVIGGTGQNRSNWIYENHKRAIGASLVLLVVLYIVFQAVYG